MSIYEKIKADTLAARLANRVSPNPVLVDLLVTLKSDLDMIAKTTNAAPTDESCVATIRKFLKGNQLVLNAAPDNARGLAEKSILEGYLPTQLTEAELEAILDGYAKDMGSPLKVGALLGKLAGEHASRYDGKLASQVANRIIQARAA